MVSELHLALGKYPENRRKILITKQLLFGRKPSEPRQILFGSSSQVVNFMLISGIFLGNSRNIRPKINMGYFHSIFVPAYLPFHGSMRELNFTTHKFPENWWNILGIFIHSKTNFSHSVAFFNKTHSPHSPSDNL